MDMMDLNEFISTTAVIILLLSIVVLHVCHTNKKV
jgi:hypothetical protein